MSDYSDYLSAGGKPQDDDRDMAIQRLEATLGAERATIVSLREWISRVEAERDAFKAALTVIRETIKALEGKP